MFTRIIPGTLSTDEHERRSQKPDLEALTILPPFERNANGALLARRREAALTRRRLHARPRRPERFYRRGFGPSRWLFVVVDSGQSPALIVTAYGLSEDPPGWPTSFQ